MIRITLCAATRQVLQLLSRQASAFGDVRAVGWIRAIRLVGEGYSIPEVSRLLDMGEQTVRDRVNLFLLHGPACLVSRRPPGRPGRLTDHQKEELVCLISQGPLACGYASGCWDSVMIADLALCRFGVRYHPHHICRLLARLGLSYQKARFLSDHLNPEARERWLQETWPEIVRLAKAKQAVVLFGDECSFAQWGSLFYTWAPRGEQPTVPTTGIRKGHKLFGALDAATGQIFTRSISGKFNADSYIDFLKQILATIHCQIILIQDGAPYHTAKVTKEFIEANQARLTAFRLPAYSPDFNPIEHLWKRIKKAATHLRYFPCFDDLVASVEGTIREMARKPQELFPLVERYASSLRVA
jgi:transposase